GEHRLLHGREALAAFGAVAPAADDLTVLRLPRVHHPRVRMAAVRTPHDAPTPNTRLLTPVQLLHMGVERRRRAGGAQAGTPRRTRVVRRIRPRRHAVTRALSPPRRRDADGTGSGHLRPGGGRTHA